MDNGLCYIINEYTLVIRNNEMRTYSGILNYKFGEKKLGTTENELVTNVYACRTT